MTTVYRTTGAWGSGKGSPLTKVEVDTNFYGHETRLASLEGSPPVAISVTGITASGTTATVHYSDSSTSTFTLPTAQTFDFKGEWTATTPYAVNDWITHNGTLYAVIFAHTSASSFDPNANDGMGHNYYEVILTISGATMPTGGATGQVIEKSSGGDFAFTFGYKLPTGGNAHDVLNKNSGTNQDASWGRPNALYVTFSPSTASGLISTNVADALEEIEAKAAADFLPLAGGTMTGALTLATDPASALQAATKQYVDGLATNLGKRARVRVLDDSDSDPATSGYTNGATIDGVTLVTGDQVLRAASGHQARNGVWVVAASGGAARAAEFDTYNEHPGSLLAVEEGTTYADTVWLCTSNVGGTLNTTAIIFNQSSATGALLASNNLSDLANAATARGNLGVAIGTDVQAFDAQLFSIIPQNSKSAAYTTVLTDGEKHILHPSADTTARTFTIDSNANVAYPIGTAITFVNQNGAGVVTIAITSDTMRLAGSGATGSRTLAANGLATALKIASTEWIISGTGLT